jgi:TRAF3-interacting protein 1
MTEQADDKLKRVVEATKSSLLPYVSKAELLEKYLPKPPFGFLQMVIREVIDKTGFAEGLFTPDDLNEKLKKERDEKLDFLKKIINCVVLSMRKNIAIKPAKIAAGLEPEKTNLFLRMLVECAKNKDKYEWQKVVARIKSGQYKDVTERIEKAQEDKKIINNQEVQLKSTSSTLDTTSHVERPAEQNQKEEHARKTKQEAASSNSQTKVSPKPQTETQRPVSRQSSAGKKRPQKDKEEAVREPAEERKEYSHQLQEQTYQRPSTARPPPPKIKNNLRSVEETSSTQSSRATSAKSDSSNGESNEPNVILTTEKEEEEDGIIIEENVTVLDASQSKKGNLKEEEQTGFLVEQLRHHSQNVIGTSTETASLSKIAVKRTGIVLKTTNIKNGGNTNLQSQAGGNVEAEISKLRTSIQILCAKTHPLGKSVEYIQEDLDAMQKELEQWRKESLLQKDKLQKEKEKTEDELKNLKQTISSIDHKLENVLDKIRRKKVKILKGEMKLEKLLRNVVSH